MLAEIQIFEVNKQLSDEQLTLVGGSVLPRLELHDHHRAEYRHKNDFHEICFMPVRATLPFW